MKTDLDLDLDWGEEVIFHLYISVSINFVLFWYDIHGGLDMLLDIRCTLH